MLTLDRMLLLKDLDVFPMFAALRRRALNRKKCCGKQIYPWSAAISAAEKSAMASNYPLYKKITGE